MTKGTLNEKIICDVHGEQLAVFVCNHIETASDVAELGPEDVCCKIPASQHTSQDIHVECRRCATERGLIPQ